MAANNILYYGKADDLPERIELRAGPVALIYEQGDLRYIRLGSREILRRVYVAVRDRNWGTIAPRFSNVTIDARADSFTIRYQVENRQGEIDFAWQGVIEGRPDGTITFAMDGEARSTFWRNRIGFCVLHPAQLAGQAALVEHIDGSHEPAVFPVDFISSQPVQPFAELRAVIQPLGEGLQAEVGFRGDVFEMEDQRNWTDASYKTFSTPLRLPYPVQVRQGERVRQSVTLRLREERPGALRAALSSGADPAERPLLAVETGAAERPLPGIGLGMASHGQPLSPRERDRLRGLRLDHLRVDLFLGASGWRETLRRAADEARALEVGLAAALILSQAGGDQLWALRRELEDLRPPVALWLCYPEKEHFAGGSPVDEAVRAARAALEGVGPQVPFCAGTNTDLIFLKRSLPALDSISALTFAICPQVHAFDNDSLVETLEMQGQAVRSAARLWQAAGRQGSVMVSPVTLKMRYNPYATGPAAVPAPRELPAEVDVRQMSLFGAAWTLGSFKYLAEAGARLVTYYETSGWRGVMETEPGSAQPDGFPSQPGTVFPLYHVLEAVGQFSGGSVLPVQSSQPLRAVGMLLRKDGRERLLLANLTPRPLALEVRAAPGHYDLSVLDETCPPEALQSPDVFRARAAAPIQVSDAGCDLLLNPYAVAWLDHRY